LKAGVITFPGSNCDHDMVDVLSRFFNFKTDLLWHKDSITEKYDLLVVPGGFSYGDYLRSGAIARFAVAMKSLGEHAAQGRPVIGICNGFQILCESHLLPGVLIRNNNLKHIAKTVPLIPGNTTLTSSLSSDRIYNIPVSHGDGNYRIDEDGLKRLHDKECIAFRYAENPNGSVYDIAGITSENHRILGMMPHPERAADPLNTLGIGSSDGYEILNAVLNTIC
jgi:phosphoribosylformylglycinamidine synthase subunit PurQ / glutaminase